MPQDCEQAGQQHSFQFKYSSKSSDYQGDRTMTYLRTDFYFCTKCLKEEKIERSTTTRMEAPDWYLAEVK